MGNAKFKLFRIVFVAGVNLAAMSTLVNFSGCCWKTPEDKSYRLEVTQKHLLPYTHNQALTFEDEEGTQFEVTVNKQYEIIKLAMTDDSCVECCQYNETLELEIISFNHPDKGQIFPVLVAGPLRSTPYNYKEGAFELKLLTAHELDNLKSGSGIPIKTENALSFDNARKLICTHDEPIKFCNAAFIMKGVIYENVAEVKLIKLEQQGFSFLQCFFNDTGLLSIRQTIYGNDLPADTLNYYRAD